MPKRLARRPPPGRRAGHRGGRAAGRPAGRAGGRPSDGRRGRRQAQGRGRPAGPRAPDGRLARRAPATPCCPRRAGRPSPARLEAERVWIVDPLDGTREFCEPPRGDWAVHVALVIGGEPVAGAVALPGPAGSRWRPRPPPPMPPAWSGPPRVIVSRSRPPVAGHAVAAALGGELVEMGSAGAKAMAVILGEADVYAHGGGQYEWDSAAPVAVALGRRAARLPARRLAARLQPPRPVPPRPARLPTRAGRAGDRAPRPSG